MRLSGSPASHLPPTTSRETPSKDCPAASVKAQTHGHNGWGLLFRLLPWGGLSPWERASENSGGASWWLTSAPDVCRRTHHREELTASPEHAGTYWTCIPRAGSSTRTATIIEVLRATWGLRQVRPQTRATWTQVRGGYSRITVLAAGSRQRPRVRVSRGPWAVASAGTRARLGVPAPGGLEGSRGHTGPMSPSRSPRSCGS